MAETQCFLPKTRDAIHRSMLPTPTIFMKVKQADKLPSFYLKGLSHEIDFKTFDKNLQNLA
jgi:hypothetical protein